MANSQTSDLRIDVIESTVGGQPPVFPRGVQMGSAGLAVTVTSVNIPGALQCLNNLSGSGAQLTNIAVATTNIAFAYNFLSI